MQPEVARMLEALPIAALVLLFVPKRGLSGLSRRLRDLRAGRRRWLFEPPLGWSSSMPSRNRRILAEALRIFELGLPVYVTARLAEQKSAQIRGESRLRWDSTPSALFAAHLTEALSEPDLLAHLRHRSLPPPATKLDASRTAPKRAMSMDWWLDRQVAKIADGSAPTNGHGNGAGVHPPVEAEPSEEMEAEVVALVPTPVGPKPLLTIKIVGRIEIRQDEEDLAVELLRRPVVAFIYLHLLTRALIAPNERVLRSALAEEMSPGLGPDKQRVRLRNRMSDMLRNLPKPLVDRVAVDGIESLKLDLAGCSVDLLRLEAIAAEAQEKEGILPTDLIEEAQAILAGTVGEVLPGWESFENEVNGGRGSSGELVAALRERADSARITLMGALAANHLARRESDRAIPLLEQALERQPDREDLARNLRAAYLESGQLTRAAEIQKEHALEG